VAPIMWEHVTNAGAGAGELPGGQIPETAYVAGVDDGRSEKDAFVQDADMSMETLAAGGVSAYSKVGRCRLTLSNPR